MALRADMEVREYLEVIVRRRWIIIFSFLFVLLVGSVYSVVVPEEFKSTTTILVIPQRVPESYVQSTVSIGVADRLATIKQQVMSRTRLLTVMDEVGLFPEVRAKRPPESMIENMRKRIEINVVSDRSRRRDQGTEAFSISFEYGNPELAMLTVSRLASLFIEENLKTREQQAVGTSEFLDSQLKETKVKLEAQEDRLKQYKLHFMGELPQELQTNLTALTRLQDQYRTNSEGIRSAADRKVVVEAQLSMLERTAQTGIQMERGVAGSPAGQDPYQALVTELTLRRTRLADLSARYTDRYPEIPRLRREVAQMEARLAQMQTSSQASDNQVARDSGVHGSALYTSPREMEEVRRLKSQITATDAEIASLKRERETIQKRVSDLQTKVDRSPRREQEMISLTRDYENLKQSYNELLRKKLEADISQNLEKRQKGEQFQIIDPANYPTTPFKPDRKMILGLSFLLASVLGFGGAFGLEMADTSLRSSREFKQFFDLPILARIPVLQDDPYQRRANIRKLSIYGGILSFMAATSLFLVLYGHKIRTILNF